MDASSREDGEVTKLGSVWEERAPVSHRFRHSAKQGDCLASVLTIIIMTILWLELQNHYVACSFLYRSPHLRVWLRMEVTTPASLWGSCCDCFAPPSKTKSNTGCSSTRRVLSSGRPLLVGLALCIIVYIHGILLAVPSSSFYCTVCVWYPLLYWA